MSNKRVKTEFRVGVGASSILMVLVVLALTAVSLLSFQSALNAEALTNRNLQMTTAFYEASARVQWNLADMDMALEAMAEGIANTGGADGVSDAAINVENVTALLLLRDLTELTIWETGEGQLAFSFAEDAGDDRKIEVQGVLTATEPVRYTVTRYQLVSAPMDEEWDLELMMPELGYMGDEAWQVE